ncbi:hypothetical protein G7054_g12660 [Neopestalotiopsis clavispora]|nr:hypothetical protein G7054_g12660 [Neopestalotiopsis clavispora]
MKSAIILVGAAMAVAQNFSGQPSCATSCLSAAITGAGCALDDSACQCGPTQSAIASSALGCLLGACTAPADLIQAQSAGSAACAAYSATAGSGSSTGTMSITTAPTTTATDSSMSNTLSRSGDTIIGVSTNSSGSATETKTLSGTVQTPSVSNSASVSGTGSTNVAPTAAPAKIVGGVLAGLLGVVAAL